MRKNPFWEHVPGKTRIYSISLKADFLIRFQKDVRRTNDSIWRRFRAEISHTRLIQGQKLKLSKVLIYRKLTAVATTTASQQLSRSGEAPGPSRTGTKYPVRESLTSIICSRGKLKKHVEAGQGQRSIKLVDGANSQLSYSNGLGPKATKTNGMVFVVC